MLFAPCRLRFIFTGHFGCFGLLCFLSLIFLIHRAADFLNHFTSFWHVGILLSLKRFKRDNIIQMSLALWHQRENCCYKLLLGLVSANFLWPFGSLTLFWSSNSDRFVWKLRCVYDSVVILSFFRKGLMAFIWVFQTLWWERIAFQILVASLYL